MSNKTRSLKSKHKKNWCAIGLMSGTSMDGIDVAIINSNGKNKVEVGGFMTVPYSPEFRRILQDCIRDLEHIDKVERALTVAHGEAVRDFIKMYDLDRNDIDIIGFHGHTILHAPEKQRTLQIGDGRLLAEMVGIPVVNNFRSADVAAGGEGAPLAPLYHKALAIGMKKPVAILNIGGVGNVTYIANRKLLAFDTGPGNALLDDFIESRTGKTYDKDGEIAAMGRVNADVLEGWLRDDYFDRAVPKSLDRNGFDVSNVNELSTEDGAATLTAFTVGSIIRATAHLPQKPKEWLITGGGRHNPEIMRGLEYMLETAVKPIESIGSNGDALEAEAFAYLAIRHIKKLPLSLPTTTGVKKPQRGGNLILA